MIVTISSLECSQDSLYGYARVELLSSVRMSSSDGKTTVCCPGTVLGRSCVQIQALH
jgi:hypothetical protein